jgi:MtrB/PioB family decaheme-associated outer membrane protein
MDRTLTFASIIVLALVPASYAADGDVFSGNLFLGGNAVNLDHKSGKFNEYNAIGPGLVGGGNASLDNDRYYLNAEGSYLGEDDMYLKLKGGKWGSFKYSLFYTEFPHNYSFGDRSVFTNPGSQFQTLAPGTTYQSLSNSSTWPSRSFDEKIRRKDVGGAVEVTAIRPFFFNFEANRLQREGQKVFGAVDALGTSGTSSAASPGAFTGRMTDVAQPIDDHTTNANALFGWKNKQFFAAFGGGFSQYSNQAEFTRFQEPFFPPSGPPPATPAVGTIVGAPDNKSWNMRFNGTAKLPYSSVFSLNADYQRNTSRTTLLSSIVETGTQGFPVVAPLRLSQPVFNGDVEYWHVGSTLTSSPVKDVTTKLYFKYLDRRDNSDIVTFSNPASTAAPLSNSLYSFTKTSVGGEAAYRFLKNLKGILGYDFTDTRREDLPITQVAMNQIPDTWVHTYNGQLVYNPLDWLGARLRYQKRYQDARFEFLQGTDANTVLANNIRRFDAGNRTQDMVKFTADITPVETLGIALEYAYKLDNFQRNALGFQQMEENEFIFDANYLVKGVKLFAFFDYDVSHTSETHRQGAGGGGDPSSPPSPAGFDWRAELRNNNYAYGLGTSFPISSRFSLIVQYDFEKNNGTANFTSQSFTAAQAALGINNGNIDIGPWDDYTRQNISARLLFEYDRHLAFSLGYLYTQFRVNDGQYTGYQFVALPTTAAGASYLSGAYLDQSYKANIVFLRALYRF